RKNRSVWPAPAPSVYTNAGQLHVGPCDGGSHALCGKSRPPGWVGSKSRGSNGSDAPVSGNVIVTDWVWFGAAPAAVIHVAIDQPWLKNLSSGDPVGQQSTYVHPVEMSYVSGRFAAASTSRLFTVTCNSDDGIGPASLGIASARVAALAAGAASTMTAAIRA